MAVMSDKWIAKMARDCQMITPFREEQVRSGISFGVSSYGYDISISNKFKMLKVDSIKEIDPKTDNSRHFYELESDSIAIPARSFVLAQSVEYFKIPREVVTICFGKSTYARSGIIVNVTPFEPEWEGFATISISNTAPVPARIYANEGIAQILFIKADEICQTSYADKKGKYQAQQEITHSKSD